MNRIIIKKLDILVVNDELEEILENRIKLDEFINEENYELLKGNFQKLITCQLGSRVLQSCISKTNKDIMILIFSEIQYNLSEVIVNQYGNYFCQKFFTCLPFTYRVKFLESVLSY